MGDQNKSPVAAARNHLYTSFTDKFKKLDLLSLFEFVWVKEFVKFEFSGL